MFEINELTKRFGTFTALDNVTCRIPDGCIYGMVGSNGAGKSTFLRLLSGVYKPTSGTITADGQPVWENPEIKSQIAFIPDDLYFIGNSSTKRMAKTYEAVYPTFDRKRFEELAKDFNLDITKNTNTLSKGMRRQAAIILALAAKPRYIFFDETFDGLDPVMRNLVKKLILSDVAERGACAIITSHSLRELEDTCDQLALLHKGGLILESDISDLKTRQYKIQLAFADDYDRSRFDGIDIVSFSKSGSVANMIVKGDRDETAVKLRALDPLFLDILPLTLEEVFTYEMETLGYSFDIDLTGGESK